MSPKLIFDALITYYNIRLTDLCYDCNIDYDEFMKKYEADDFLVTYDIGGYLQFNYNIDIRLWGYLNDVHVKKCNIKKSKAMDGYVKLFNAIMFEKDDNI